MKKIIFFLTIVSFLFQAVQAQGYNPWQDYSRPQIGAYVPIIGGQYVPVWALPHMQQVGGRWGNPYAVRAIPRFQQVQLNDGRTVWAGNENGTTRYYSADPRAQAEAQLIEAQADRRRARTERIRARTERKEARWLNKELGSKDYADARDGVKNDLDSLGTVSGRSAQWLGYQESETRYEPNQPGALPGTSGDRRQRNTTQQQQVQTQVAGTERVAEQRTEMRDASRTQTMNTSLDVLQKKRNPTMLDTLRFWKAAEAWAQGDSVTSHFAAMQRNRRWETLLRQLYSADSSLVRSSWPGKADTSLDLVAQMQQKEAEQRMRGQSQTNASGGTIQIQTPDQSGGTVRPTAQPDSGGIRLQPVRPNGGVRKWQRN